MLRAAQVVVCDAGDLSEAAGVVLFESRSLLQEGCEFLGVVSLRCGDNWLFWTLPLQKRHSVSAG